MLSGGQSGVVECYHVLVVQACNMPAVKGTGAWGELIYAAWMTHLQAQSQSFATTVPFASQKLGVGSCQNLETAPNTISGDS